MRTIKLYIRNIVDRLITRLLLKVHDSHLAQCILKNEYRNHMEEIRQKTPDSPAAYGFKVFSQTDEDGIIENIFSRIGTGPKTFLEIGVQTGAECNTHYLLLKDWRGVWVEGNPEYVKTTSQSFPLKSDRLEVKQLFVTRDNILPELEKTGIEEFDFISLDIDGNDFYVMEKIASQYKPRVFCVEYNAKFPPIVDVKTKYREDAVWELDDYAGASIRAWADLFERHGYFLTGCSCSGSNAFFVDRKFSSKFTEYSIEDLFVRFNNHFCSLTSNHSPTLKYLKDLLGQ